MVACVANPLEALLGQLSLSDSNNAAAATLGASSLPMCGHHSASLPATSAGSSMPSFSLQQLQDAQMTLQSQLQSLQLAEALLLSGRGPAAAASAPLPQTTQWMPVNMQGPANMLLADASRTGTRNALAYDITTAQQYGIPQVGSPPQAAQHRVMGSVGGPTASLSAAWPAGGVQATGAAAAPGGASAAGMPALLSQVLTLFPPPGKQKRSGASRRRKANMYRMLDAAKALASVGPLGVEGAPAQLHALDGDGTGAASLLSSGACASPNGSGLVSGTATPGGSGDLSTSIQTVLLGTQASRPATPPSSAEGTALSGGSFAAMHSSSEDAARTLASMLAAASATSQRPCSPSCLSSLNPPSLATSRMHGGAVPGAFMSRSKPPSPQASFIVAPPVHAAGGFGAPGAVPAARALSRPPQRSVTMPVVMQRSHMAPSAGPQIMLGPGSSRMLAPGTGSSLALPPHMAGVNVSWQAAGGVPSVERHQTYPLAQQQQQQYFLAAAAAAAEASSHVGHQQATHMLMQMPYRM